MPVKPSIIPNLVYNDAPAAIAFLCDAFGFVRHVVHGSEDGRQIQHAQLLREGCMIMVSSATPDARARFNIASPADTGGTITVALYMVLDDVDAHHAVAAAKGAIVIAPPHDNDYGGRGYEVRDCEGNYWSFGSYDPFA